LLFNFITIGYVDNPEKPEETFYQGIERLPPASKLFYNPFTSELTIERYWDLETRIKRRRITDPEAVEQFTALFAASVKKRLRSDVPLGTSLSGGLDSSAVVAMMRECEPALATSKAFTTIFPGFEMDESRHSKMIAEHFDLQQYAVSPGPEDMLNDWDLLCHHQEEPFGSASIYAQFRTYKLAKENGVTVLLDGQGADETLAGYHRYYKWYWQELFIKRKLLKSGEIRAARKLGIKESFGIKNIIASLFPDLASVILEKQYLVKALQHEDLSPGFVKQQSREAYYATPDYFNLNGALYFNTCVHGLEELLRYADRNSMAHGREVRLPFLNHELVEFIFSLPSHFKIRKGWTKWLLRTSMQGRLPAAITWRKDKVGFEPPQKAWMENQKWKEFIIEARKKLVNKGVLRKQVIDKPLIALGSHDPDNFDWRYLSAAAYL
jgi:asparagine synthase (glutamine-hydrolysing)